jgi:hypothetical protein
MDRLLNVMTGLSLGLIFLVLASIRRAHIRVEYSVSWLLAGYAILALSLSPSLLHGLTSLVGFQDAPLALLFIILCVFLIVFFRFSVIISNLRDANIALAQRLAILEFRVNSHEESQAETSR